MNSTDVRRASYLLHDALVETGVAVSDVVIRLRDSDFVRLCAAEGLDASGAAMTDTLVLGGMKFQRESG